MKNFETFGENLTQLKTCLAFALQEQTCEMEVNEMIELDVIIKHIFEPEQTKTIIRMLGLYLALMNSLANPVLYAFWYPEFRKYFLNVLNWFRIKDA